MLCRKFDTNAIVWPSERCNVLKACAGLQVHRYAPAAHIQPDAARNEPPPPKAHRRSLEQAKGQDSRPCHENHLHLWFPRGVIPASALSAVSFSFQFLCAQVVRMSDPLIKTGLMQRDTNFSITKRKTMLSQKMKVLLCCGI